MQFRYTAAVACLLAAAPLNANAQNVLSPATTAASSAAYREAVAARTPEDPKLVWTASQVALVAKEVAPNVYAVYPDDAPQKTAAGIPVATSSGFIIGTRSVIIIDTMLNKRLAEQVIGLVREKTKNPIHYIVNTSYHGDHSYGNQFFPSDAQVIQHRATYDYIAKFFAKDIAFMTQNFGSNQGLSEIKPVPAAILLQDKADITIDLGDQQVRIRHLGFAQTPGDLWVLAAGGKVVFTGNPVIARAPAFPWLLDGHLRESLATMQALRAMLPADAVVVPGHGEPTTVKAVDDHIAYLDRLKQKIEASLAAKKSKDDTLKDADMPDYKGYKIYPWVHTQVNVPAAYDELSKK